MEMTSSTLEVADRPTPLGQGHQRASASDRRTTAELVTVCTMARRQCWLRQYLWGHCQESIETANKWMELIDETVTNQSRAGLILAQITGGTASGGLNRRSIGQITVFWLLKFMERQTERKRAPLDREISLRPLIAVQLSKCTVINDVSASNGCLLCRRCS